MRDSYPTRNGIAVPIYELTLPQSRYGDKKKYHNNHHAHFTAKRYERSMALCALRDLERHQYEMPIDVHQWLHQNFDIPELASEEQAAREVIDAYDKGEQFKVYDRYAKKYFLHDIQPHLVDAFMAKYSLAKYISLAAD